MGNPQERLQDICWLAGLTDGDGCIAVQKQSNNGNGQLVPELTISTTCKVTRDHLDTLFDRIEVGRHWTERTVTNQPNWKTRWVLQVRGMKRMKPLLMLLLPHLVTKRREAELLLQFIESRLDAPMTRGYTPEQLGAIAEIKALKRERNGNL